MKIIKTPDAYYLESSIINRKISNRIESILSLKELPMNMLYTISKYAPLGKYDIFKVTLEVGYDGIKTPLLIGNKAFTSPLVLPLIENFPEYIYAIFDTTADDDRWKQYDEIKPPEENILDHGFSIDPIEGVLPPNVFKYEKKFFEKLQDFYMNMIILQDTARINSEKIESYYETLSKKVITLEVDTFFPKEKPKINAKIVYDYPRYSVPVSVGLRTIYIILAYDDYGSKIRPFFRISPTIYAPFDFEIMLYNFDNVKEDLKNSKKIIEQAPELYDPIKDKAKELIDEYINYLKSMTPIANEAKEYLSMFNEERTIASDFSEYLQKTLEGYKIFIKCNNPCDEKAVQKVKDFEKIIDESTSNIGVHVIF